MIPLLNSRIDGVIYRAIDDPISCSAFLIESMIYGALRRGRNCTRFYSYVGSWLDSRRSETAQRTADQFPRLSILGHGAVWFAIAFASA
jgi:hypothetical protein